LLVLPQENFTKKKKKNENSNATTQNGHSNSTQNGTCKLPQHAAKSSKVENIFMIKNWSDSYCDCQTCKSKVDKIFTNSVEELKKRNSAPIIEDVEDGEEEGNEQGIDPLPTEEVNIETQNLDFFEKIFSWQQFTANRNLTHEQKIFLAEKYSEMKQKFVEFCNEKKFVSEGKLVTKEDIDLFFTILKETNNANKKRKLDQI